jgi:hypothetical protein
MFSRFTISILIALFLWSCEDTGPVNNVSKCINSIIEADPPDCGDESNTTVDEYYFQNELVYVFDYSFCCCDYSSPVLNAECETLGYLGGFEGNSIINGEDFSHAVFQRTVWP